MASLSKDLRSFAAQAANLKVITFKEPKPPRGGGGGMVPVPAPDLPRLRLNSEQVPAVADWQVGQEYTLLLRVEQTGKEETEYSRGTEATFSVRQVAVLNQKGGGGGGRSGPEARAAAAVAGVSKGSPIRRPPAQRYR